VRARGVLAQTFRDPSRDATGPPAGGIRGMNPIRLPIRALLAAASLALLLLGPAPASRAEDDAAPPNILYLLADDQGWAGTSVPMHPEHDFSKSPVIETPHVERLAKEGMRFSAAYAPAPMCEPTRAAFQTGLSPAALHWTRAGPSMTARHGYKLVGALQERDLAKDHLTIGALLQAQGYATAHFGKWHIGGGGPGANGYDAHDGDIGNEAAARFKDPNPVDIFGMTDRAIAFMKKSGEAKKPFFIQMSWLALHAPMNALAATIAKYEKKVRSGKKRAAQRAALSEDLDTGVGRLLAALDRLGLAKNTYVIYTSDNGSGGGGSKRSNRRRPRLAGGKGNLLEGGVRVPLIVRGPGVFAGSWSHVPVTLLDFHVTFAQWAGARKLPHQVEGGSLQSLLMNEGRGTVTRSRPELFFHFPHYDGESTPHSTVLSGSYKLVHYYEDDRVSLFDLAADLRESGDLSSEKPELVASLKKRLATYLKEVKAHLPTKNAAYDPDQPPRPPKKGPGHGKKRG